MPYTPIPKINYGGIHRGLEQPVGPVSALAARAALEEIFLGPGSVSRRLVGFAANGLTPVEALNQDMQHPRRPRAQHAVLGKLVAKFGDFIEADVAVAVMTRHDRNVTTHRIGRDQIAPYKIFSDALCEYGAAATEALGYYKSGVPAKKATEGMLLHARQVVDLAYPQHRFLPPDSLDVTAAAKETAAYLDAYLCNEMIASGTTTGAADYYQRIAGPLMLAGRRGSLAV